MLSLQGLRNKLSDSRRAEKEFTQPLLSGLQGRDHYNPLLQGLSRIGQDIHRRNLELGKFPLEFGQQLADQ
ncbi:hypothetical protein VU10_04060 [Desulfobulbus sp. US1]|nr:hypothetical protein [Desulfobulbus sp. US4]MCW5204911.1 hypothetical protein [Desulfobulbus sp. N2]MCW5209358.1 hypothetical protein [Desulfobulbus sp. US1]MCW5210253.1 hypothetical protein [Desulfobulbus sp. N3]MCW5214374.1 hypothetical protein [Desulfobulbus sp. US5]WLE97429.1 MAG: hypothetical protein QTN59_01060 [Candidatus Electrothrix communis]